MEILARCRSGLIWLETWLAAASLLTLLALSFIQIIIRNLFDTGIPGLEEAARHLVLYVMFFGAVLAVEPNHHIKIDVLGSWLSRHQSGPLARFLLLFAATVCALFCQAALRFWQDEWQYANSSQQLEVLLNLVLPVGFGLLSLHFLLAAILGPGKRHPE